MAAKNDETGCDVTSNVRIHTTWRRTAILHVPCGYLPKDLILLSIKEFSSSLDRCSHIHQVTQRTLATYMQHLKQVAKSCNDAVHGCSDYLYDLTQKPA